SEPLVPQPAEKVTSIVLQRSVDDQRIESSFATLQKRDRTFLAVENARFAAMGAHGHGERLALHRVRSQNGDIPAFERQRRLGGNALGLLDRQTDRECRSFSRSAFDRDTPLHRLDQSMCDGKTKPGTAMAA